MSEKMSFQHRIANIAGKIQTNKYISAITNGLISLMPVTIVGSIGSLINSIPIDSYQEFLVNTGLKTITAIPNEITNNLLAIYAVYLIAVKFAESFDLDGVQAGMLSLMAFLIVTPFGVAEGEAAMSFIGTRWLGAPGLFTAFIVALLVSTIYVKFQTNGWVIKMPSGVPPTVSKSFSSLVPSFVIMFIMLAVRFLFMQTAMGDVHTFIFSFIAKPLTALGSSFPALFIAIIVAQVLWLFGIHGAMIIYTVFIGIWMPLGVDNLTAYNAGTAIPHMVTGALFQQAVTMGSGQTLGLTIAMLFGKSAQYKTLGKLSIVPNACGINEPVIFATPLVMNFTLAIPFILTPLIILTLAYVGMKTTILPILPGLAAPLGTPVIIAGLLQSGGNWRWGVFQALTIVISFLAYAPFFKKLDREAYAAELEAAKTTEQA